MCILNPSDLLSAKETKTPSSKQENKYMKEEKQKQEEFLKGREYERMYQLDKEKDNARKIVIKWFSSLSLEKNQLIADDVSKLLHWLTPNYKEMTPTPKDWEERFDEMEKNHGWLPEHKERVIVFISQLISDARQAELDRVIGVVKEIRNRKYPCETHNQPRGISANNYDCTDIHIGRNEAFSDVLEELTKLKNNER